MHQFLQIVIIFLQLAVLDHFFNNRWSRKTFLKDLRFCFLYTFLQIDAVDDVLQNVAD